MSNDKKAYKLYTKGGYSLVIEACNNSKLKYDKYSFCNPCDAKQPIYNYSCLVCGTSSK